MNKQKWFSALRMAIPLGIALLSCQAIAPTPAQAKGKRKMKDGSVMRISRKSFADTVASLKQAIEGENLMVIHVIDGQKMMRMAGKKIGPMNQIFFFHPRFMRRVWEANPMAGIQIPLKFIVMERPDRKVVIRYLKPSSLLGKYKGVEGIARELDRIVNKIVNKTVR